VVAYSREPKLRITAVAFPLLGATPCRNCNQGVPEGDAEVPVQEVPTRSATNARADGVVQPTTRLPGETAMRGRWFCAAGVTKALGGSRC
jgi:hypothetical protein